MPDPHARGHACGDVSAAVLVLGYGNDLGNHQTRDGHRHHRDALDDWDDAGSAGTWHSIYRTVLCFGSGSGRIVNRSRHDCRLHFRVSLMKRIIPLFLIFMLTSAQVKWEKFMCCTSAAAPPSYTGPGDVVSGATVFYSCTRAYNNSWAAGTGKLCSILRQSDNHTCDILSTTGGDIGLTANCSTGADNGSTAVSFCNATTCEVHIAYDQSGNAVDANDIESVPLLGFSCFGSLPCVVPSVGNTGLVSTATISVAQPFTHSFVAERISHFTAFNTVVGCGNATGTANGVQSGFSSTASTVLLFAGTVVTQGTANDSVNHAIQNVYNGASSSVKIDDGAPTGSLNPGAANCDSGSSNQFAEFASGGNPMFGDIGEAILYPSGLSSGNQTSLCHNQSAYYSLGLTC